MQVSEIFATPESIWASFVDATALFDPGGVLVVLVGDAAAAAIEEWVGAKIKQRLSGYPVVRFVGNAVHLVSHDAEKVVTVRLVPQHATIHPSAGDNS
jgi:hypothetical protein